MINFARSILAVREMTRVRHCNNNVLISIIFNQ